MTQSDSLIERLREVFVSKEVFDLRVAPLEKILYTATGLILISVLSAIIFLVVKK